MSRDLLQVLLVEDNAADVYLFRKAFESTDLRFELTVIEDGSDAMAFARSEGRYAYSPVPDLAVLDLNLPKHDGIQVLRAIRQSNRLRDVPVVVTSSSESMRHQAELEQLRVSRYIRKPPDLEEFLQIGVVLKDLLVKSQANRDDR
jgi:chemotaxis family two-component system response regulator Rcp1